MVGVEGELGVVLLVGAGGLLVEIGGPLVEAGGAVGIDGAGGEGIVTGIDAGGEGGGEGARVGSGS